MVSGKRLKGGAGTNVDYVEDSTGVGGGVAAVTGYVDVA